MAIPGPDGSISILTKIDTKGFDKGQRHIGKGLDSIKGKFLKAAQVIGVALGAAAIINFGKASVKAAEELSNALMSLQGVIDGQGRSFKDAQKFVADYISDGLVPATEAITAYKNLAMRGYEDDQIQAIMNALKDSAAFGRQMYYSLGEAVATAAEGLRYERSILVDNAGVTKKVSQMWEEYAASIGTTANNLTLAQKRQAEVNGILSETVYQMGDAARIADTYSGQTARLQFNLTQLKIAFGNLVTPIIQRVLPAINSVIAGLSAVFVTLSNILSSVFGLTAEVGRTSVGATTEAGEAMEDYGDAVEAAGKKAAKAIAPFDELFILTDATAGAAADAGGPGSIGASFDIPELFIPDQSDVAIPKWAKTLETWLKSLKELGEGSFGENIVSFFKGFWDVIKAASEVVIENIGKAIGLFVGEVSAADPNKMAEAGRAIGLLAVGIIAVVSISGVVSSLSGIATGMGSLLGVIAAHPIAAMAVGLAALYGVHVAYKKVLWNQSEEKALIDALNTAADAIEDTTAAYSDYIDETKSRKQDIENHYKEVEDLADEYFGLAEQTERTEEENEKMRVIADKLVKELPDLKEKIDETTGAYTGTKEELYNLIAETKKYYLTRAAEEMIVEQQKRLLEAEKNVANAFKHRNDVADKLKAAEDKLREATEAREAAVGKGMDTMAAAHAVENQAKAAVDGLKDSLTKANMAVWTATKAQEDLTEEYEDTLAILTDYEKRNSEVMEGIVSDAEDTVDKVGKAFKLDYTAKREVEGWLKDISKAIEHFKLPSINANAVIRMAEQATNVPMYATGTVIPPNAAHLAIVGDNTREREIIAPESVIRKAVRDEIGAAGGDITVSIPIELDGAQIYRAVVKVNNGIVEQTGATPLLV